MTWPDHLLYGVELPVHGWHRHHGQIQLFVTLPDGSRGYFPAGKTALWEAAEDLPSLVVTGAVVHRLRLMVEALQARHGGSCPPEDGK